MVIQARLTIRGVVQGVGYRVWAWQAAQRLGLRGYVRNLPSGDVEVVAEGEQQQVDRLVEQARIGPPAARVADVSVEYGAAAGEFEAFSIRP